MEVTLRLRKLINRERKAAVGLSPDHRSEYCGVLSPSKEPKESSIRKDSLLGTMRAIDWSSVYDNPMVFSFESIASE